MVVPPGCPPRKDVQPLSHTRRCLSPPGGWWSSGLALLPMSAGPQRWQNRGCGGTLQVLQPVPLTLSGWKPFPAPSVYTIASAASPEGVF